MRVYVKGLMAAVAAGTAAVALAACGSTPTVHPAAEILPAQSSFVTTSTAPPPTSVAVPVAPKVAPKAVTPKTAAGHDANDDRVTGVDNDANDDRVTGVDNDRDRDAAAGHDANDDRVTGVDNDANDDRVTGVDNDRDRGGDGDRDRGGDNGRGGEGHGGDGGHGGGSGRH